MTRFRSKVGFAPLLAVVVAVFLVDAAAIGLTVPAMGVLDSLSPFVVFLAVSLVPALLLVLLVPLRYRVGVAEILVDSGVLRWRIPIADVHRAAVVHGLRPAPALSTERVRLDYQRGDRVCSLDLSPVEPYQFMALLAARDSGLVFDGRQVVRRHGPILLFANAASRG